MLCHELGLTISCIKTCQVLAENGYADCPATVHEAWFGVLFRSVP